MADWNFPESAPKNGTIILGVFNLNESREKPAYLSTAVYWSASHNCWREAYSGVKVWEKLVEWTDIPKWTSPRFRENVLRETQGDQQ